MGTKAGQLQSLPAAATICLTGLGDLPAEAGRSFPSTVSTVPQGQVDNKKETQWWWHNCIVTWCSSWYMLILSEFNISHISSMIIEMIWIFGELWHTFDACTSTLRTSIDIEEEVLRAHGWKKDNGSFAALATIAGQYYWNYWMIEEVEYAWIDMIWL